MTSEELETRFRMSQEEQLVMTQVEEGVRVYAPQAPHRTYIVAGSNEHPTCTCPDFEHHRDDPDWCCKHILAVQTWRNGPPKDPGQAVTSNGQPENGSQMLVKRSVSPDGRIDSLSVEFSVPISGIPTQEVASRARRSIQLSSEITDDFRKNGKGKAQSHIAPNPHDFGNASPAIIESIGGMDTKWGRRLFLGIRVDGQIRRFFGTQAQISRSLASIGYPQEACQVREGLSLSLPCRVHTKPTDDGRYVNVVKLLPVEHATPQF